jgi:hypothetical protein
MTRQSVQRDVGGGEQTHSCKKKKKKHSFRLHAQNGASIYMDGLEDAEQMRNIRALKTRINGRPHQGRRVRKQNVCLREVCYQNILRSQFIVRHRRVHSCEVEEQHGPQHGGTATSTMNVDASRICKYSLTAMSNHPCSQHGGVPPRTGNRPSCSSGRWERRAPRGGTQLRTADGVGARR